MGDRTAAEEPLASILTPVYNGEQFLEECIQSVLGQTYKNWEYILVDNCSTDGTMKIAESYAGREKRIRVVSNTKFVNCEENHNIAFSQISPVSKYCKVVSADDRLFPDALPEMIRLAEAHPRVGIVGSYQQSGDRVKWKGLPEQIGVLSGREVCRLSFLQKLDVFGNPSSVLYRSDLLRKYHPFFPHSLAHADTSACYRSLQEVDFGFVHKVLSTERVHAHQVSSRVIRMEMGGVAFFDDLLQYGRIYLSAQEWETLKKDFLRTYHRWLGGCLLKMRGKEFWGYHVSRMRGLGYPIEWKGVLKGAVDEIRHELRNPSVGARKLALVLRAKLQA